MKKIQWSVNTNNKIDDSETHFKEKLLGVTNAQIKSLFGKLPRGTGKTSDYSDSLIIVNDTEKSFMGGDLSSGIYTLYTSYGEWRIGGHSENKFVNELKDYINSGNK